MTWHKKRGGFKSAPFFVPEYLNHSLPPWLVFSVGNTNPLRLTVGISHFLTKGQVTGITQTWNDVELAVH